MTDFFQYDTLTWPEVSTLPRDIPLILPLGEGYTLDRLASALGEPLRAGLLPPLPFGWQGSGLAVPESTLGAYLANLLDSLRDDGFTCCYALTPQGIDLGLGADRIALSQSVGKDRNPVVPLDSERRKVILLPIGHTEQHGYHLPLSVDTLIIDAIGKGTSSAVPEQACCLPVMPYGVSTHRQAFAGTLNAGGRAFEDFWVAVIDALAGRGFGRFYAFFVRPASCICLDRRGLRLSRSTAVQRTVAWGMPVSWKPP
jgi:hypothetical protein